MSIALRRLAIWGAIVILAALGIVHTLMPQPVPADLATVTRGPLRVTITEEGETRIRDIYRVSAPVTGRLLRIRLKAGDDVVADETLIAELQPIDPAFLDLRTEAEMRAALQAAEAARDLAQANVERARAQLNFAETDLKRVRRLAERQIASVRQHDEAELNARTTAAELAQAEAMLEMRVHELERARSQLLSPVETVNRRGDCACVPIRAPVSGKILRILQESEVVVQSGTTLVEIGDPGDLEIVVDLLSADAVRVEEGQRVIIDDWGGAGPLNGQVSRVEPYGFTKVSALGIEEQRVNVRVELTDPGAAYQRLAHGFRVEASIVMWEQQDVLKLPWTALFRRNGDWTVFQVEDGRARERVIKTGHDNGLEVEVLSGLNEGDTVVVHPGSQVADGVDILERPAGE